jgi:hypothetical protein
MFGAVRRFPFWTCSRVLDRWSTVCRGDPFVHFHQQRRSSLNVAWMRAETANPEFDWADALPQDIADTVQRDGPPSFAHPPTGEPQYFRRPLLASTPPRHDILRFDTGSVRFAPQAVISMVDDPRFDRGVRKCAPPWCSLPLRLRGSSRTCESLQSRGRDSRVRRRRCRSRGLAAGPPSRRRAP